LRGEIRIHQQKIQKSGYIYKTRPTCSKKTEEKQTTGPKLSEQKKHAPLKTRKPPLGTAKVKTKRTACLLFI
jgi:hypothetical protein